MKLRWKWVEEKGVPELVRRPEKDKVSSIRNNATSDVTVEDHFLVGES